MLDLIYKHMRLTNSINNQQYTMRLIKCMRLITRVYGKLAKYAIICILMVSSVLRNTSQVEHTKKCSRIDSEQVCETKRRSSELFNSVFLRVTLVVRKCFLVE